MSRGLESHHDDIESDKFGAASRQGETCSTFEEIDIWSP
jgi:hypothetical protein